MPDVIHARPEELPRKHWNLHEPYEYYRRILVPPGAAERTAAALYELPPGKAGFPYHYHLKNEESYYILSGHGVLRTPAGERPVCAGAFLFFPAGENGAHKLTNTSDNEMLVYLDFDVTHDLEVAVYPDSGKLGIWGKGLSELYKRDDAVEYYDGE